MKESLVEREEGAVGGEVIDMGNAGILAEEEEA